MDIEWDAQQIRNLYYHYWIEPDRYADLMVSVEADYDCISALLLPEENPDGDFVYFLNARLRMMIHLADTQQIMKGLSLLVSSDSPIIDHTIYYAILNSLPLCSLAPVSIVSQRYRNWLIGMCALTDASCAELATTIKGLIIYPDTIPVTSLLQSVANAFLSNELASNLGMAFSVWISHTSFQCIVPDPDDTNMINNLLIIFNYLHWSKLLDGEFILERQYIRENMTTPIDILFNRPVFTELIINILYFVIAYSIPHNIGDFYRLLLKLPYQTVEDIEIYSYHLYRIEQLSGDSEIYSLLCSRLRRIGYNMLDCLRNSDDVDLVEILHRITLALCSISLDKETIRLLITIMYEGHYDISRIIFYRLSTIDWINEVDIIGLDRRILIDRLEDALYGNTELLSKLYEYRDNNIVKAEIVVEVDPISGEHLGNDKVQLPDTHIILNRSTLEMWFEYAGCIDPYTRKPLSWDDIKTVI